MAPVTLYTKTVCPLCDRVKVKLREAGIEFEIVNLDLPEYAEAKTYVSEVLGAKSVPVVVSDVHEPILGYRPDKIKALVATLTSNERKA